MKKITTALGASLICIGLLGCNTMRGMGQDVERGGEKMQSGASGSQQKSRSSSDYPSTVPHSDPRNPANTQTGK